MRNHHNPLARPRVSPHPRAMHKILLACVVASAAVPAAAEELDPAKVYAVVAGVLRWQDAKSLSPFSARHRKDRELHELLLARGVPKEHTALLLDEQATLHGIRAALTRLAAAAPKDATLLFYFAGHGLKQPDG